MSQEKNSTHSVSGAMPLTNEQRQRAIEQLERHIEMLKKDEEALREKLAYIQDYKLTQVATREIVMRARDGLLTYDVLVLSDRVCLDRLQNGITHIPVKIEMGEKIIIDGGAK